jgi:predicted PurR-regulated permease PerM
LSGVGADVSRQFALRAVVNLFIAAGMTILLFALGVDAPLLWGILTFFLAFIPYIGIYIATVPGVVLALAQYGLVRALLVIAGVVVLNLLAENGLAPLFLSQGLSLSIVTTTLSVFFWAWLLGPPGAFLGLPLTLFSIAILDTFPETRWLTRVMLTGQPSAPQTPHPEQSPAPASD